MTSSQCDKLRDWACELRKLANGPVNEGFPAREKLFESADAMCQAADTILELREMAQKANDENTKLRELCKSMRCALVGHDDKVYLAALDDTLVDTGFDLQKLGIEVD